jgi:hypothetical protein
MIIHAALMAAFFADQVTQVPVVVQCVLPPNTDPWWKQWIQPILNLVSIVVVVGIAAFSFGATSRKEHRRWVLDQKASEWRSMIVDSSKTISQIHELLSETLIVGPFTVRSPEQQKEIHDKETETLAASRKLMQGQVFIRKSLVESQIIELWSHVSQVLRTISDGFTLTTSLEDIRAFTSARDIFLDALYRTASSDLGLPPHGLSPAIMVRRKENLNEL